jgi:hypothetical protein
LFVQNLLKGGKSGTDKNPNPQQPAWKAGCHAIAAHMVYIGFPGGFTWYTCNVSGPDKRGHVFLPLFSAKDVAFITRQNVTLLYKLYLISSAVAMRHRK